MLTARDIWEKVYQCRRLVNTSDDSVTIDRLHDYISQLTIEALEAEGREAKLRLHAPYDDLVS